MKLFVSLPELRRIRELLALSKDKGDRSLYDRINSLIEKETESRGARRTKFIKGAAKGQAAGGNGTWF